MMLILTIRLLIIFSVLLFPITSWAFDLSVTASGGSGSWSGGIYSVNVGSTVTFGVTPSNGTANYSTCWDYGTPPSGAKAGEWDHDVLALCYDTDTGVTESSESTETHTFNQYGEYGVWVYVTDSTGTPVTEKAYLTIRVGVSGTTIDPTSDCGANNLDNGGSTDNGTKLADCINALGSTHYIIEFPAGTYRFVSTNIITGGNATDIEFKPVDGATVTLEFDPTNSGDDTIHKFLNPAGNKDYYFHHLNFTRDLDGGAVTAKDGTIAIGISGTGGTNTIQNCTFTNMEIVVDTVNDGLIEKCNFVNWGARNGDSDSASNCYDQGGSVYFCYNSAVQGVAGDVIAKNLYSDPSATGNGHHFYMGAQTDAYSYIIGYYVDHALGKTDGIFQGGAYHTFFYNNSIIGAGSGADAQAMSGYGPHNDIEWIDNQFSEAKIIVVTASTDPYTIQYNNFEEAPGAAVITLYDGEAAGVNVNNNVFGNNVPDPTYIYQFDTAINEDWCNPDTAGGTVYTAEVNPSEAPESFSCISTSGNTSTSDTFDFSDPGPYEFVAPTNLGATATDAGSGMGATARFPFQEGALSQGSDGSNNYSQVELYADRGNLSSWANIRYADVDHNWSGIESNPRSITIHSGQNIKIMSGNSMTIH